MSRHRKEKWGKRKVEELSDIQDFCGEANYTRVRGMCEKDPYKGNDEKK